MAFCLPCGKSSFKTQTEGAGVSGESGSHGDGRRGGGVKCFTLTMVI